MRRQRRRTNSSTAANGVWRSVALLTFVVLLVKAGVDGFSSHPTFSFLPSPQQPTTKCRKASAAKRYSAKSPISLHSSSSDAVQWQVYVDQSPGSLDKGGGATLDAFLSLAPAVQVQVEPAFLGKTKSKGQPTVRCISSEDSFDVGNVDSVDKVYRILSKHMGVKGVGMKTCNCLKWKFKGNGYLEANKVDLAIDAYDQAIATGVESQEGILLLMRATAYLKRAETHREELKEIVRELTDMVPDSEILQTMYQEVAAQQPELANPIFRRVLQDTAMQETQFRQTQYRHGLYQYALLRAAQDSLRATQLLPGYAESWRRAGEILSELWKLKESAQYYERAIELDKDLSDSLRPVVERLNKRQELLDKARYGWSEDTLRLALDVAR